MLIIDEEPFTYSRISIVKGLNVKSRKKKVKREKEEILNFILEESTLVSLDNFSSLSENWTTVPVFFSLKFRQKILGWFYHFKK